MRYLKYTGDMMEHEKDIEQEVERTMHALDNLEQAKTDAYFFSRLEALLENDTSRTLFTSLWAEPRYVLATAAVVLIILFNLFSVAEYQQYYQGENIQQTEEAATLAEEYKLNVPFFYAINEDTNGH